jgi:hypothetical protein
MWVLLVIVWSAGQKERKKKKEPKPPLNDPPLVKRWSEGK